MKRILIVLAATVLAALLSAAEPVASPEAVVLKVVDQFLDGFNQGDAKLMLARDSELKSARGDALRVLLYLFGRDEAVRYLRTG